MMFNTRKIQILLVICSMTAIFVLGCGKKAPPLPPLIKGNIVAAPFDLKYKAGTGELVLSWKHEIDTENAKLKPDGFEVFMATKTFEDCEGCPFAFKLTGFVSMPGTTLQVSIEKGYKYYFRVQALDEDGIRSEYSKTVMIESK